jgi:hypothetical protein
MDNKSFELDSLDYWKFKYCNLIKKGDYKLADSIYKIIINYKELQLVESGLLKPKGLIV